MAGAEPFLSGSWHLVSSLRVRLHSHAAITRQRAHGRTAYVLHNPTTGRTYRFAPAVYLLLDLLDGRRTVGEAWSIAADRLDEAAPTQDQTIRLLARLHDADLLQTDKVPDVDELMRRHNQVRRARIWQSFANPLAIRLPLWDPDRFLTRTLPWVRPLFGPPGLVIWLAVVLSALVLAGQQWPALSDDVTDRLLATENVVLLALVFPVIKALHELGHGYAVKAAGGEVHEIGVMFLVLLPIPYVDATAANAFRSRWRRAGVAAAGIMVETFVAALMLLLWSVIEPGAVRSLAYDAMVVAGFSTLLINGNPLLRFDGYFVLCDVTGMPNLSSRSTAWWGWLVRRYAFGTRERAETMSGVERAMLMVYAPLSLTYRIFITIAVALVIARRFFAIGVIIALWGVVSSLLWPVCRWLHAVAAGPALARQRGRAVGLTLGVGLAALALLLLAPLPLHTAAEGVIWLPDTALVRAGVDGYVARLAATPGERVAAGAALIESEDPQRTAELALARARVASAEARLLADKDADPVQAAITRRELDVERSGLEHTLSRMQALTVNAASDGTFVAPRPEDLPGRFHHRGDILGYVVPSGPQVIRVLVRQADIGLVRGRERGVEVRLVDDIGTVWPASVTREVPLGSQDFPSLALSAQGGGQHAVDTRDPKHAQALTRLFQFDIALPPEAPVVPWGSRAWVRFDHGYEPLGLQWWRRMRQLFLSQFDA